METRNKVIVTVIAVAIVGYSVGYARGQSRTIQELGSAAAKEATLYLATRDHIRHRFG